MKKFNPIMIQGGVVAVNTRNNFLIDYIRNMPNTLTVRGTPARDKGPAISDPNNENRPDHETPELNPVIHWEPVVETDREGRANFSFRMNDQTGMITVEVQGMDESGNPLQGIMHLEVRP